MIAGVNDWKVEAGSWVNRMESTETAKQRSWGREAG